MMVSAVLSVNFCLSALGRVMTYTRLNNDPDCKRRIVSAVRHLRSARRVVCWSLASLSSARVTSALRALPRENSFRWRLTFSDAFSSCAL